MAVGAFGPWATRLGLTVDGTDDEVVAILALVAGIALIVFVVTHSRALAAVPLLVGLVSATLVGGDLKDPAGPFGGPGRNVHLDWGIWTVLAGSISLVLASAMLLRLPTRRTGSTDAFLPGRGHAPVQVPGGPGLDPVPAGVLDALNQRLRHRARLLNPLLVAPIRGSLWRARRARMAERAAETARQMTVAAIARERHFRREFAELAGRLTPYVTVEISGLVYFLPARQRFGIGRFASLKWKEHQHLERALDVLKRVGVETRGRSIVDVGANIGTTIVPAVGRLGFAAGFAIEPEPENLRLLRANLVVNGLDDVVQVLPVAASNREGRGELVLRPLSGGKHRLARAGTVREPGMLDVALATLDSLVESGRLDPETVGLLWLDVQGHELEVLQGAGALLSRSVPIVTEFDTRELTGGRLDAIRTLLARHYTSVVDLSRLPQTQELEELEELEEIAERHAGTFTDLLVLRPERDRRLIS